ncbi:MAG: hypothetical protein SAL70_06035 [Scytonema sp. PMC 1070.18]|nr:hypothetical protein [Scytonema sp. PMC 1070.18]
MTLTYGCEQKAQQEVQLEITSVQPTGGNGVYSLEGSTNLPDSSQIAVTAVRYLLPTTGSQQNLSQDEGNSNRSILARRIVEVEQGRWQTDLDLWDVAPDGRYQEVWQAKQPEMKLRPDSNVAFIVTYEPAAQLNRAKTQLEGKQLRFTNEGEVYVSASQSSSVPLPEGKTTPPQPVDLDKDVDKQIQSPVSTPKIPFVSSAKLKQTNAPLKTLEFMR